jgi:hypothetical protein
MTMSDPAQDLAQVQAMIGKLEPRAQVRVNIIADILRDLINAEDGGHEAELAFTLVLAERTAL